jgi:Ca2+-binding EF-hand superfamily protein
MKFRAAIALLALFSGMAAADDRADYNRRAAEADQAAYRQLDLNGDGRLTPEEVRGDVNFRPRFDDIDTNRDGTITPDEMRRYLEQTYDIPGASIIGL